MAKNDQEKKDVLDLQSMLRAELEAAKTMVDPPSGFVIGTKGRQFNMPDGSINKGPMHATILDWATMHLHYPGAYNPAAPSDPNCWAIGRDVTILAPSDRAPQKQADECSTCPKNQWNSAVGGGKGKACKNTRRLMVAGSLEEDAPVYTISVSPTGIKHFDKYVASLTDKGLHPIQVVTEISFDPDEMYPSLRFKALQPHDKLEVAFALKEANQGILLAEPQLRNAA